MCTIKSINMDNPAENKSSTKDCDWRPWWVLETKVKELQQKNKELQKENSQLKERIKVLETRQDMLQKSLPNVRDNVKQIDIPRQIKMTKQIFNPYLLTL